MLKAEAANCKLSPRFAELVQNLCIFKQGKASRANTNPKIRTVQVSMQLQLITGTACLWAAKDSKKRKVSEDLGSESPLDKEAHEDHMKSSCIVFKGINSQGFLCLASLPLGT